MRSDAANVCELTEAVLEEHFLVLKIKHRNKIISGDEIQSQYTSAIFQLDTDKPESEQTIELVLSVLPQADTF